MKCANLFWVLVLVLITYISDTKGLKCQYCGIRKLCPLPYNVDSKDNEQIDCPVSCFKFDGKNDKGDRVLVRECSSVKTQGCKEDEKWNGATGTSCSCLAENCNSADKMGKGILILTLFSSIFTLLHQIV